LTGYTFTRGGILNLACHLAQTQINAITSCASFCLPCPGRACMSRAPSTTDCPSEAGVFLPRGHRSISLSHRSKHGPSDHLVHQSLDGHLPLAGQATPTPAPDFRLPGETTTGFLHNDIVMKTVLAILSGILSRVRCWIAG
jgi:hypothetical protein